MELADIVREHGDAFRRGRALTAEQRDALDDIPRCRTEALGGHLDECEHCGFSVSVYNSCRNRHCPKCQCLAAEKWVRAREARLLPTHHFHVVFTLPAELRALARYRPTLVFDLLIGVSSETLQELARTRLGAQLGVTSVLHTWTRDLRFHPHVHCIVTGGGLSLDGQRWISTRRNYLFPALVMGETYRGKFLDALRRAYAAGRFKGFGDFDDPEGFDLLMAKLAKHKSWVVYAKKTFREPRHVVRYLGRYTHRVGIANSRLVSLVDGQVTFRTKDGKTVTLAAEEFLGRFVLHVLPKGYTKIRHFGLFAPSNVKTKLAAARTLLDPTPTPPPERPGDDVLPADWIELLAQLTSRDLRVCPRCGAALVTRPLPTATTTRARAPP